MRRRILGIGVLALQVVPSLCWGAAQDFDTASAWVRGVKWARGANRDRTSPSPTFNVRFRLADGTVREYPLGKVEFKDRFFMHRRFTAEEQKELAGATPDGFFFKGLTDEDAGVAFEDARVYREELKPIATEPRAEQDPRPFPVAGGDVVPAAAAAKKPCALSPQFNGGSEDPLTEGALEKSVRREGRCLVVDLRAPAGAVKAVTLGGASETSVVKRVNVPFLTYGGVDELAGGFFRYAFFDWYRSNASRLVERDVNGVRTMVAEYLPKTDGTYNPVRERIVIALSDEFADVLPEIPNPPSKFKAVTASRVWRSHASSDRARDKAFWRTLHDAGIRQMAVMDHETMWRDGGESFTFVTEAAKGKGGDAAERDYARFMIDSLGYLYGPYNNYTDYSPNNARWWEIDRVSRASDGSLVPAWMRCYAPKPTVILPLCERIVPEAQAKFGFTGAYCDVHTAIPPWNRTDYDARCPGAAAFAATYYAYGELLLRQKELWNGPVWSEGGCHFMYAGLADGNYARDGRMRFYEDPWLVDFDLRKIHPLETDFGMGSLGHFSPGRTDLERQFYLPHMPDGREALVDLFIGATLAFGHAGYLVADWMFDPPKMFGLAYCGGGRETFVRGLRLARKSYFMTQAIAARYALETVEAIRYFDAGGVAQETSEAIRTDAYRRRQVYVRYSGGVHVLVNGHAAERLRATVGGTTYDLPPRGYRAWTDDGAVLVESGDANGTGPRRDFAKGPDYVFDEPHPSSQAVTLALFADSLTNCGYQDRLMKRMHEAGYSLYRPVGTHTGFSASDEKRPDLAAHDGFGGFTFDSFLSRYQFAEDELMNVQAKAEYEQMKALGVAKVDRKDWRRVLLKSPLVDFRNGRKVVDVRRWLDAVNGGKAPDYIVLELGTNGTFGQTDETVDEHVQGQLAAAERLLAALRTVAPDAVYAFCTVPPGSDSEEHFQKDYGGRYFRDQVRRNFRRFNARLEKWIAARNDPRVVLVRWDDAIDTATGYANAVHPNLKGGEQLGDALFDWLVGDLEARRGGRLRGTISRGERPSNR